MSLPNQVKKFLARPQQRQLEDLLVREMPVLNELRLNKESAARYLAKKLGFEITLSNLNSAIDTMGVKWTKSSSNGGEGKAGGFKQAQVLRAVCRTMLQMEARLKDLDPTFTMDPIVREFAQ